MGSGMTRLRRLRRERLLDDLVMGMSVYGWSYRNLFLILPASFYSFWALLRHAQAQSGRQSLDMYLGRHWEQGSGHVTIARTYLQSYIRMDMCMTLHQQSDFFQSAPDSPIFLFKILYIILPAPL